MKFKAFTFEVMFIFLFVFLVQLFCFGLVVWFFFFFKFYPLSLETVQRSPSVSPHSACDNVIGSWGLKSGSETAGGGGRSCPQDGPNPPGSTICNDPQYTSNNKQL